MNTKVTPRARVRSRRLAFKGGANLTHRSDPRFDTADFADGAPGNLRADYVLPRKTLQIADAGVFWPLLADPLSRLTGVFPFPSSDHRAVWIDVSVPAVRSPLFVFGKGAGPPSGGSATFAAGRC